MLIEDVLFAFVFHRTSSSFPLFAGFFEMRTTRHLDKNLGSVLFPSVLLETLSLVSHRR